MVLDKLISLRKLLLYNAFISSHELLILMWYFFQKTGIFSKNEDVTGEIGKVENFSKIAKLFKFQNQLCTEILEIEFDIPSVK